MSDEPDQKLTNYRRNASTLNDAIQSIGMGAYQWQLFVVIGFGWASDNLWPIVTSLILSPVTEEFHIASPPFLTLAQNIGLLLGAVFWGFGCDIFGRRWAFNLTIGLTALFGLVAAASPTFAAVCVFTALWSIGVGGNLPVDSAIFLEFLPGSHQYLLTVLSVYWALAQLLANLVAWPILGNLTCPDAETCTHHNNMGWRYFLIAMGGLALVMCLIRWICFTLYESPKFLMGKARYQEAVAVVHEVARRNGRSSALSVDDLRIDPDTDRQAVPTTDLVRQRLEKLSLTHIRALFDTPRRAWSTALLIVVWALIGLGFPLYNAFLPYIQQTKGAEFGDGSVALTYRNSLIIAAAGLPGSLVGGVLVEIPYLGRRGAISSSAVLTGAFLLASTTATTSAALLGWNCAYSFTSSVLYAVLYAYTPELFLTKDRGTGNALTAAANRVGGILAPIIALVADLRTSVPVYVSGGLFVVAGLVVLLIGYESRGKASL
ncbi:putative sugar transporter [Aspergillus clavatus NRRL 1]|uniref:Sugar transporter, putative n=1 Tax=Aspergillus clavatus (strain ATCC 1007 / CBS 513.65 / DSM 816 / NCTC 3887 / NRRL 1 / QM 1276 / 107) TaxID=344612 RepID=A1CG64_ASPCL|nr:sugar transporter, putative [Aspergillus clavatus NRRL 1]EAW10944.1 sugar transporter, putative [Aspergillus clavatus NRRL 1]